MPDSAAVDEAVKLTRAMGMEAACGFINAVLRNLSRGKDEIAWPDREADPMAYLSVMGSMPCGWWKSWWRPTATTRPNASFSTAKRSIRMRQAQFHAPVRR